jgi:GNAT superfamily N-acetyltransferase
MATTLTVVEASPQFVDGLSDLINQAFAVDHFFKYEEFYDRVNPQLLHESLKDQNLLYLLGFTPDQTDTPASCVLVSRYVEITAENEQPVMVPHVQFTQNFEESEIFKKLAETQSKFSIRLISSISQVSVHPNKQGKGLGKVLIQHCEDFLTKLGQNYISQIYAIITTLGLTNLTNNIETNNIPHISYLEVLVSVRPELLPFYSKLGYRVTKENVQFSATHICLPEYKGKLTSTIMEKVIG